MLETANANSSESRRGDSQNSSSGGAVAGEKRTGEETSSQSVSQDKASKKMKKCKQDIDTSGNVHHGHNCFPVLVAYFSCKQDI